MEPKRFHSIKPEIRVLGIDDGCFIPHTQGMVDIVGVVYRGGTWFDGFMNTQIEIDGLDATEKIATMIKNSPHYGQLRVVVLDGITFGGFNVVDIHALFTLVDLPVLSVVREKPNLEDVKAALKNLPNFNVRWQSMQNAGELFKVEIKPKKNPVYVHVAGILVEDATKILKKAAIHSNIPEALRVAHLIASGLIPIERKDLKD